MNYVRSKVQLFGTVSHSGNQQIASGAFRFSLANVELSGRRWITLADVALHHSEHSPLANRHNAPWVRGRLQTIFAFQQSPDNLECESRVDDDVFLDRMMLNVSFVAETTKLHTAIQIPFICSEGFAGANIWHGELPDRNTDHNLELISSMVLSFAGLLLASDNVDDYQDCAVTFGRQHSFGVRNGIPYDTFFG
jgi:hypothetical protein